MTSAQSLAALVRHVRYASGLTQRGLAELAGVSPATVTRWESGTAQAPPVQRALEAAGAVLWAVPSPPEDAARDVLQLRRLDDMHPLDRIQQVVLADGRDVAGITVPRWLDELDELSRTGVLIVGEVAAAFWLPDLAERPPITELVLLAPRHWRRPRGQTGRLRVVDVESLRRPAGAGLPGHVWRTAVPVHLGGGPFAGCCTLPT